jgi:hypothetical protein
MSALCAECLSGIHSQCIGQGCYCEICTFEEVDVPPEDGDLDFDEEDYFDCAMDRTGACGKAGSEECEFECPYRRAQR